MRRHESVASTSHAGDQNFWRGQGDQTIRMRIRRGVTAIGDQRPRRAFAQQGLTSLFRRGKASVAQNACLFEVDV